MPEHARHDHSEPVVSCWLLSLLVIPLLLVVSTLHAAPVYKWEDEYGRVHYGDRPGNPDAQEVQIEKTDETGQTPVTVERKQKQQKLLQLFAEKRAEKRQQEIAEKNEKIARHNACSKARNHRKTILSAGYLYEEDDSGNKRILSTDEFEEHLDKTEEMIRKLCS